MSQTQDPFVPENIQYLIPPTCPEERRSLGGVMFSPADPDLKAIKLRAHNLSQRYSLLREDEAEERQAIAKELLAEFGEGSFMQGPIFLHYGTHTRIGKRCFINYDITIQDDGPVIIGDDCNFGPGVAIVTPVHPLLPGERHEVRSPDGALRHMCYAKPVIIGNDCWFGARAVVCPGVTIGDGCVIGAGSVVTRDIPPMSFAAGVPCRVIRPITEADSMTYRPELLAGCQPLPE